MNPIIINLNSVQFELQYSSHTHTKPGSSATINYMEKTKRKRKWNLNLLSIWRWALYSTVKADGSIKFCTLAAKRDTWKMESRQNKLLHKKKK